ncbi:MAG: hypothetical protein KatS3mg123_2775 [Burkholderiales bacterium]|nr:MAG: hypothetical protein KatS3mg123_2775 [Burkholderiales bacterium]
MDWDVEPTAFSEFVTIQGVPALLGIANGNNVRRTGNDGFDTANPLGTSLGGSFAVGGINPCSAADMLNSNFTDCGADDHGAVFDFEFEALANGASRSFVTYYGAAGTEADADAARALVGAWALLLRAVRFRQRPLVQPYHRRAEHLHLRLRRHGGRAGTPRPPPASPSRGRSPWWDWG